jgi:hypothetical protein
MKSRLITAKNEIEQELRVNRRIDPRRKAYLTARLQTLERDIKVMGFSDSEVKTNVISHGNASHKEVGSQQYFVPSPSWVR